MHKAAEANKEKLIEAKKIIELYKIESEYWQRELEMTRTKYYVTFACMVILAIVIGFILSGH